MASAESPQRLLLVCSPGGHLLQLFRLEGAWRDCERSWVTLDSADVRYLLAEERTHLAKGPTNRSLKALLANVRLAWRLVRSERPEAILSTGAALALPFFLVGKLFGARLIYVESLTRIHGLSLTGRLVYPLADAFFVQWPTTTRLRRARFEGRLL
ncbi:MAG TPA: UDP-N-acetylglucosamine--LPS N-acetylglucosamine transferase [Solirubrobacterales bacterium]|nr:UDP-N-acetylglucosamine--LPS N-acetylglucosamine transferase [Solirubrobacterales bacterium]